MISAGTKVNVEIKGQVTPAVVVEHHFASTCAYDLYLLRIAEWSQARQKWLISDYGPVYPHRLVKRHTHVPGLDLELSARPTTGMPC